MAGFSWRLLMPSMSKSNRNKVIDPFLRAGADYDRFVINDGTNDVAGIILIRKTCNPPKALKLFFIDEDMVLDRLVDHREDERAYFFKRGDE